MNDRPALLGGTPAFDRPLALIRPRLPRLADLHGDLTRILETGVVTKGGYLERFEREVAARMRVNHAVGVSSGTSGLMLALEALGLEGEVVLPSFTFMASAAAIVWNRLTPVFADCSPKSWNLTVESVGAAITPRTSAIMAVHVFGNPADRAGLETLARARGRGLVFDAAHAFGAQYPDGPVGGGGDAEVFSTTATKLVVTGEGGVVATQRESVAEHVAVGREYGNAGGYDAAFAGINARLPEIAAVLGLAALPGLEADIAHRNAVAERYRAALGELPGLSFQQVAPACRSTYNYFAVLVGDEFGVPRDLLVRALAAENIETRQYFDPPVHRQAAYRQYAAGAALPVTERVSARALVLPMYWALTAGEVDTVCEAIARLHRHREEVVAQASS
jgi:dTDP-4-amino-4,6-dideoxygalactose transaminase